jgi:hypothetical protein
MVYEQEKTYSIAVDMNEQEIIFLFVNVRTGDDSSCSSLCEQKIDNIFLFAKV